MKKSDLEEDTPTSLAAIKGLIDLEPFADALVECIGRHQDDRHSESRARVVVNGFRERINSGFDLVAGIDGISHDAVAIAVAASFSGSPFRIVDLLPLLTFSEKRAYMALFELEEHELVFALDRERSNFVLSRQDRDFDRHEHVRLSAEPSQREREVAQLIAQGLTNYQIGMRLGLSQRTVETYVRRLFTKLDVNSRSQIAAWHINQPR